MNQPVIDGEARATIPREIGDVSDRRDSVTVGARGETGTTSFQMWTQRDSQYEVVVTEHLFEHPDNPLGAAAAGRRALVVTTPTVHRIHGAALRRWIDYCGVDAEVVVIALGEQAKTFETVQSICGQVRSVGLGRRDLLIAFGGGVCCDVVGLAASLVRRGIPHLFLPTTLVAQADASIGIKAAVNFEGAKNYVGAFTPPDGVFIDPCWLATLSARQLRCGLAEITKMAIIRDAHLFALLSLHGPKLISHRYVDPPTVGRRVLDRSIELMLEELGPNSYEDRSMRRRVDFGHTFSPTLEERSGFRLAHGEAVAIDMAVSCTIAAELGVLDEDVCELILGTFESLGLPIWSFDVTPEILADGACSAVAHRDGNLNLVLPSAVGAVTFLADAAGLSQPLLREVTRRLTGRKARHPRPPPVGAEPGRAWSAGPLSAPPLPAGSEGNSAPGRGAEQPGSLAEAPSHRS